MAVVGANRYGKECVRVMKIIKGNPTHNIVNYTVTVLLEGDFETSFSHADNSKVVPTDTTKNTIYCIAKKDFSSPEEYALLVGDHFLSMYSHVSRVTVDVTETLWNRMKINGKDHEFSFQKVGGEQRKVHLLKTRSTTELFGGIENYVILKTTGSGFTNFHRCQYTVLPDMKDRILATSVSSSWRFNTVNGVNFNQIYNGIKEIINHEFATKYSESVQATIWDISAKVIEKYGHIETIRFSLPNLHHWEIDTSRFGLSNNHDIFIAVDDPHGLIEAEIHRSNSKL